MSRPAPRFVIVPHRPRSRWLWALLILVWLLTIAASVEATRWLAVPALVRTGDELNAARQRLAELEKALGEERQRSAVLERSDQVSRQANSALQATLAERDEEIAQLRSDVAFYERLVGGTQRQGLTVHSLSIARGGDGDLRYRLTLTQNLKKAGLTRGGMRFAIEGVQDGKLVTLDWAALRQTASAPAQTFEFRYFQQLDGSVMLPAGFTPHRVRVLVERDGGTLERVFSWDETQQPQGG